MNSVVVAVLLAVSAATSPAVFRLPPGHDAFFVEDDLVYRRFLALMQGGAYRQIDQDRGTCEEVDQGTWEQTADGSLLLHSTHRALRFRALIAGPLSVVLDSQEKIDGLPVLATAVRRFLASTGDSVFTATSASEFAAPPVVLTVAADAETFRRDDLQSLLPQLEHAAAAERTNTYRLALLPSNGSPTLLILQDAVYQPADLPRVRREYHVAAHAAPPFYFAQTDARTFARRVGTWKTFRYPGGIE